MIITFLSLCADFTWVMRKRRIADQLAAGTGPHSLQTMPSAKHPARHNNNNRTDMSIKLIIFDKDGTLVDFHSMWIPWARATVSLLERETGMSCGGAVYKTLGVCPITNKVSMGSLAEKTLLGIRGDVSKTLQNLGLPQEHADAVCTVAVPEAVEDGVTRPVCDLPPIFHELSRRNVRSVVCTADSRKATLEQMDLLGIAHHMEMVVCGNDEGIIPKPSPHCAVQICKKLGVSLSEAIMVGDTVADVKMGKVAGLRASVAVLSGIGNRDTLGEYSDYFLEDVSELPLLVDKLNADMMRG